MNVLVTGGTGHLGGELLVVLSQLANVERVFCLVRPKHGEDIRTRLARVFELHGDSFDPDKMQPIEGDLLDAELVSSLARQEALSRVEVIVHCAANTSFSAFQGSSVQRTNVGGLARLLRWAAGLPRLRTFLYVGTAAICGRDVRERVVGEEESPNLAARHLVRYTRSKLQAELLVREQLRPEQVLIARPSILLGDRRGLSPRSLDVLWAVAAINRLRLIPVNPHLPLDIVPVDYAAEALAALLFAQRRHDVYHVSAGAGGSTSAHALSLVLSARFPDLPPFEFDERLSLDGVRRWLRGMSAPRCAKHADYLRHWARMCPSRGKLYALFAALAPYLEFMQLGQVFDNSRLLGDTGVESPTPAELYLPPSLEYLQRLDLIQSMTHDLLGFSPARAETNVAFQTRGGAGQSGAAGEQPRRPWALAGIIGTGQSLSVGAQAQDAASTTPSFDNLKLSLGTAAVPPFDPGNDSLSLVPLAEPIRPFGTAYPSAYPQNIYGETPHTAMASQVTALARAAGADYVSVHTAVGENGQGMAMLRKGATEAVNGATSTGRAYAATLFEVAAIQRLAAAQAKTYGIGAVVLTHGETDSESPTYEAELVQLWTDYNADLSALTGQAQPIPLFVSQQHGFGFTAGGLAFAAPSTLTQWRAGVSHPDKIVCTGPKYQYPYAADNFHLVTRGYRLLGEKLGEIYFERVIMGRSWRPLEPTAVRVNGRAVTVTLHVPVPPLAWDEALPAPHQTALTEWLPGKGFELRSGNTPIAIESVVIEGDAIVVTAGADIPAGAVLGYAATSDGTVLPNLSRRWGQLRDSDPLVGALTNERQPNYAVAFEWNLP